ncbi:MULTISPECIES: glycosyltransferase family 2 protein [Edwardsiella]|uniref:Polymyxin resistance protein ArnC, glycosyl transferase n=2 Tax=Edwardsiella anguillarum TaxID=1821960 RepID=A0A076LYD3_9GAMM|nr:MULTISPECIES: glycosyltransferase family 2 protein [Edwardsiella]AKM47719.1 bactoprenol glucosyl transferase [Edwardsiella sp. EA181011]GAJ68696.1 bactoprenol glucosyl transferase [Edwardsiella piscicida]AIJ10424.1 Polymyxin resistance protein ArnC, glycosyl transferase [Edwardsiella anguillarum ET080813]AKR77919.1 glycosyltransferase family 2 protein [Edwardsiella sp. LADL05-105]KAB0586447.1 glycosyltransferase family 2 protein [Edwardsiella anguillarum]
MKISLVVPVFNEESAIPLFHDAVRQCDDLAPYRIEIVFVNDGSSDRTEEVISGIIDDDPLVIMVNFSRNFGKEAALFAGLKYATGEAMIPIDVDLQDPIELIPQLIARWRNGADVVLAKRIDRTSDTLMKRLTASLFYRVHNQIANPKIEMNVGDYRLMSRQVVDAVLMLHERNLFMKGLLSWVGFKTAVVTYARHERVAGSSKFNFWKLWNLALEGITSFSTIPLRLWTYIGTSIAAFSLCYALYVIIKTLIFDNPVPGYPSIMAVILFLGGIQLIGIGVLGEYIGRIYVETKQRPRFIVKELKGRK